MQVIFIAGGTDHLGHRRDARSRAAPATSSRSATSTAARSFPAPSWPTARSGSARHEAPACSSSLAIVAWPAAGAGRRPDAEGQARLVAEERRRLRRSAAAIRRRRRRMFQVSAAPSPCRPGQVASRIKDIAAAAERARQPAGRLRPGHRPAGHGDSLRNSPFTEQSIRAMLENLGIATRRRPRARQERRRRHRHRQPAALRRSPGARIDVTVSSLGDATSLARRHAGHDAAEGGRRPDLRGRARARSSSPASPRKAQAEQLTQGVPTSGRVPNGAIVERAGRRPSFDDQSASDAATAQSRFLDGRAHRRRDQRLRAAALRRAGRQRAGCAHRHRSTSPKSISAARFYRRAGKSRRRIRHAGPRRHRRAHRHHRHRQGGARSRVSPSATAR